MRSARCLNFSALMPAGPSAAHRAMGGDPPGTQKIKRLLCGG